LTSKSIDLESPLGKIFFINKDSNVAQVIANEKITQNLLYVHIFSKPLKLEPLLRQTFCKKKNSNRCVFAKVIMKDTPKNKQTINCLFDTSLESESVSIVTSG
jgi:hypothetical protein